MKVLILSHNPMSTRTSIGKTLISLFNTFEKEELCQIYVNAGVPEKDMCSSCFRITDKNVLKGVFTRQVNGEIVQAETICKTETKVVNGPSSAKKHTPYMELLRDAMWAFSPWYNHNLRDWIRKQKPTCMFVAVGSNKFLYDMALKIAREFSLPVFTYVCDDFYTMKSPRGLFGFLWSYTLRRKTERLLKNSNSIISICDEMSEIYEKEFGRPAVTVMTGTNFLIAEQPKMSENISTLRYFGKVSLNRYLSLADIGQALDRINEKNAKEYVLEIYCGGMSVQEQQKLEQCKSIRINGFISGEQFKEKFFSSDVLVHVEAFDDESVDRVRHSVSTKIADSMASGIPLLAYGPSQVASIGHLLRNNSAFVATDKRQLEQVIQTLFEESEARMQTTQKALDTAVMFHNPQKASDSLKRILKN